MRFEFLAGVLCAVVALSASIPDNLNGLGDTTESIVLAAEEGQVSASDLGQDIGIFNSVSESLAATEQTSKLQAQCDICPCCQESLADKESYKTVECRHDYHLECLQDWARLGRTDCPLCRMTVKVPGVDAAAVANAQSAQAQAALDMQFLNSIASGDPNYSESLRLQGANVNAIDEEFGLSAMHIAVAENQVAMINYLFRVHAIVEHPQASTGMTPLHMALFQNKLHIASTMLQRGAIVNNRYRPRGTNELQPGVDVEISPLMMAIIRNNALAVKLLCRFGANVNAQPNVADGISPLISAAFQPKSRQNWQIIWTLLQYGADKRYVHNGLTAYTVARMHQKNLIAPFLK